MIFRVGHLVNFIVVKNLPHHNCYLVGINGSSIYAQLPKEYAKQKYLIGDTGWAAIFQIKGSRTILSQKSPQYIRRMLEYILKDELMKYKIQIKRVAAMKWADTCKVAVSPATMVDALYNIKREKKAEIWEKIGLYVQFVGFSKNQKEYVRNAIDHGYDSASNSIKKVINLIGMGKVEVYVDASNIGLFYGKRKVNLFLAEKLTGTEIELKPV